MISLDLFQKGGDGGNSSSFKAFVKWLLRKYLPGSFFKTAKAKEFFEKEKVWQKQKSLTG